MRLKTILTATIMMVAVAVSGQHTKHCGINLSLWKNVCTQPTNTQHYSWFNVGIYSSVYGINGISLNGVASTMEHKMNGLQISGISNMNKSITNGLQLAGITNVNNNNLKGLSIAGLVGLQNGSIYGGTISGMINYLGDDADLFAIAGLINFSTANVNGFQFSGMSNVTGKSSKGVMISGLLNLTGENHYGLQFSPLANIVGTTMKGAQIGIFNYSTHAQGLQLGIFNYYREEMEGIQLGLINANPNTRVQLLAYGGNNAKFNIGARFKNNMFYTILSAGAYYFDFQDKFSATFSYRAGIWFHLYKGLSISGDIGFQHMESFQNKHNGFPVRLYFLQERLNLEYEITPKFSIFATTGYGISRYYNKNLTYDKNAIFEAGLIIF